MNTKNAVLTLMLITTSIGSPFASIAAAPQLSTYESNNRREILYSLNRINNLNKAQFAEYGPDALSIINQDIEMMQIHSEAILQSKQSVQGGLHTGFIPGILRSIGVTAALSSIAATVATGLSSFYLYDIWTSPTARVWTLQRKFAPISTIEYGLKKLDFLANQNNLDGEFLRDIGPVVPIVALTAIVTALIAKSSISKSHAYIANNAAFIKDMQEQYDNDQAVIAKLKEIKYELISQLN